MGARKRGRNREEPKSPALRYLPHLFFILAIATALAHFRTQIDSNDEGIAAMGAWRILRGEVPYRDFFAIETPLSFYLVAPFYALFGVSLTVGRVVAQLLGLGIVLCVFRLAKRWAPSPLFAAIPLAFCCQAGVGVFPFASHHWFANLFSLLALLGAAAALGSESRAGWWVAGAAGALALESLQDQGAFLLLGLSLVAAMVPRSGSRGRALAQLLAGAVGAALPLALIVLPRAGLAAAWHDLVTFPLSAYRETPGNALGFWQPFREILAQWTSGAWRQAPLFTASATVTCLALVATPLVAPLAIAWTWRYRAGPKEAAAVLAAGSVAFGLTAAHRWAPINLQWAAAAPSLGIAFWLHHEQAKAPHRRWPAAIALVLTASFGVFGVERILQAADPRIWATVDSPAGATRVPGRTAGQQIQEMVAEVGRRVPREEPLLVYGWPTWGFATLHPSPSRWDGFAPPDFPPGAYGHDAIAEIAAKNVTWIVTPSFPEPKPDERDEWKLFLIRNYELDWANPGWGLWKRAPERR